VTADDRDRILAELADRARRDFQLRIDIFDREQGARTAAITPEQKKKLHLTEEHYRRHREFMAGQRALARERLEQAHGISRHDGDPDHNKSWRGGTARFQVPALRGTLYP
jgi:hypothetical protein